MLNCFTKHAFTQEQGELKIIYAFQEVTEYERTYQLPFNIISCTLKSLPQPETYLKSSKSGEIFHRSLSDVVFIPRGLPVFFHRKPDIHVLDLHFTMESSPGIDVFSGSQKIIQFHAPDIVHELEKYFLAKDARVASYGMRKIILAICLPLFPPNQSSIETWRFANIPQKIRQQISAKMTVASLAQSAGLSVAAFSREFSDKMQLPAKEFLQDELLRKAIFFLHYPNMTLGEISEALGFSSQYYFSKFFKRRYGIAPMFYRKAIAVSQDESVSTPVN